MVDYAEADQVNIDAVINQKLVKDSYYERLVDKELFEQVYGCVAIIVSKKTEKCLMLTRINKDGKEAIAFPGGSRLEMPDTYGERREVGSKVFSESVWQCLAREVNEETGISLDDMLSIQPVCIQKPYSALHGHILFCKIEIEDEDDIELRSLEAKEINPRWYSPLELSSIQSSFYRKKSTILAFETAGIPITPLTSVA